MAEALILRVAKLVDDFPEGGQLWGAGGELSELKKTFSFLQSIVLDAEKRSVREHCNIGQWLPDLKAAFYDAEDLLEKWNLEVMQLRESPSKDEKLKQVIPSSSSPSEKPDLRLEMSARAKTIRKRIEAIAVRGRKLGLQECAEDVRVERGSRNGERSDSFVYDEEIIGRENDKNAIMNFLLDSNTDEPISVLSIFGREKIGKTALARCLYENVLVKTLFDLRQWICVGINGFRDLEREVQKIRGRETTERADDMEQLRKYLLVLDDMPGVDLNDWECLKSSLMGDTQEIKILITTYCPSVAEYTSTTPLHSLMPLPIKSSFDLLMRMACQEEEETINSTKVDVGRRIVEMCDEIPWAIRMIGSLLFSKKTEAEWLDFEREISEYSSNRSHLYAILELSYIHLPCHLKQCFAFCSLFPEDWVIDKQMLTTLWIAEGFIQPIDNVDQDIEDIAHDYFMDLLRRNFFQDCTKDELGNVTSCKMFDLLNNLIRRVTALEYFRGTPQAIYARISHLSWDSSLRLKDTPHYAHYAEGLRTFIKTDQTKSQRCVTQTDQETLREFLSNFKLLRVLDWHDSGIEKLPDSICELKHLAFLDLSENEGIVRLPYFMTRLQTLQVLKLSKCNKLIELPKDFRKLVNLRQLEISDCNALSHIPQGLGQLTLLHT